MKQIHENVIVMASRNQHKIKEMEAITKKFGMPVISRDEAGIPPVEIVEDGETFEENSFKKASEIGKLCGRITLADDSGLVVDYLDGAPGVYSARFAGEDGNDAKNNEKLLKLLDGVAPEARTARFVSVITMVWPNGEVLTARGECPGRILSEPAGENGFGYDPLFVPDDQPTRAVEAGVRLTSAEMEPAEKNAISHRGKALRALVPAVEALLRQ